MTARSFIIVLAAALFFCCDSGTRLVSQPAASASPPLPPAPSAGESGDSPEVTGPGSVTTAVSPATNNAIELSWRAAPGSIEYFIYSKSFGLDSPAVSNLVYGWYYIGAVTNTNSVTLGLRRASGLPITNLFFTVVAVKLPE